MYKEKYPMRDTNLKEKLIELSTKIEEFKGSVIAETEINEDGYVTLHFEGGKSLSFGVTDEDHFSINNIEIK